MCEGVPQCRCGCPSVGGVPQCGKVFPSVDVGVPVWEGVPQCWRVCPSVGGCAPMREGVPAYVMCVSGVDVLVTCTHDGHTGASDCRTLWRRPMWPKCPEISCYCLTD